MPSRWLEEVDRPGAAVPERIQAFTATLRDAVSTAGIFGSTEAGRYWAYHLGRTGFFAAQGIASLLASRASSAASGDDSQARTRFESERAPAAWLRSPAVPAMWRHARTAWLLGSGSHSTRPSHTPTHAAEPHPSGHCSTPNRRHVSARLGGAGDRGLSHVLPRL